MKGAAVVSCYYPYDLGFPLPPLASLEWLLSASWGLPVPQKPVSLGRAPPFHGTDSPLRSFGSGSQVRGMQREHLG